MHRHPSPDEARQVLGLAPSAGPGELKRAYRRLAREHHPDRGGDPASFHRIRAAYERLGGHDGERPAFRPARPSRPTRPVDDPDLGSVDWTGSPPRDGDGLDRDGIAAWFVAGTTEPLRALSRSPGSRLNRVAAGLAGDLTSQLTITTGADDRGRQVATVTIRAAPRRARRALDRADLGGAWTRRRGSSTTSLQATIDLDDDRQRTAVRIIDRLEELLEGLGWPMRDWRCSRPMT